VQHQEAEPQPFDIAIKMSGNPWSHAKPVKIDNGLAELQCSLYNFGRGKAPHHATHRIAVASKE
jgi:hypothetical protein